MNNTKTVKVFKDGAACYKINGIMQALIEKDSCLLRDGETPEQCVKRVFLSDNKEV